MLAPASKAALSYVPLPARTLFSVYLINSCGAGKKCSDFLPAGKGLWKFVLHSRQGGESGAPANVSVRSLTNFAR